MSPSYETNGVQSPQQYRPANRLDSRAMSIARQSSVQPAPVVSQKATWPRIAGYALAGSLAAVALGAGIRPWLTAGSADGAMPAVEQAEPRRVTTVRPERQQQGAVTLPSTVEPFQSAQVYSRVAGYVTSWNAELGARVEAGDVLAVIDTPELDQELLQARSDLNEAHAAVAQAEAELAESQAALDLAEAERSRARADLALADSRLQRRQTLFQKGALTQDDLDTAVRDRDARAADVAAADAAVARQAANLKTRAAVIESQQAAVEGRQANVRRLEELYGFRNLVAPFDGVVTRRNVEVGQLVTAGGTAPQQELYVIAQTDRVRVQTPVPQSEAAGIRDGSSVVVRVPELPGQDITATVTRTSQSLDPGSRTLLAEIELPNPDGRMYPGIYAEVVIETEASTTAWVVPTNTLRMQVDGPHVVVEKQGVLEVRPVRLGRDYGRLVAVLEGLAGSEQLVVNPTDDLRSGMTVSVSARPEGESVAAR